MKNRSIQQRFLAIINPFRVLRLKRNIRQWIGKAVKNPKGIEAEFVAQWSQELRFIFGL